VVKTKIEALGGIVDISTGKSKGTKFTIRLPLTLSIIKALLVKVSDEKYALPLGSIAEILEVESEQINKLKEQELIQYRGQLIPVIRLKKLLKTPEDNIREPDRLIMVIVKKGERHFGLVIDDLVGQQEIVIKSLGEYLADIQIVSGATILGDGSIALILDINHVA
jgi:two-component system chemotaxis sensor kinase CheA